MDYILNCCDYSWPNIVFALDQYLLTYHCDDGICPNAMHARGVALQMADNEIDILMKFYLLVAGAVSVTSVANHPFFTYLLDQNRWNAKVFYSATDTPPPYLSQCSIDRIPDSD